MVTMTKVESSNIYEVGYDEAKRELHVTFKGNAAVYVYHDVPAEEYKRLATAPSVGKYLNKEIKGVFIFDKRNPERQPEIIDENLCDDCKHVGNTKNIGEDNECTDCSKTDSHFEPKG